MVNILFSNYSLWKFKITSTLDAYSLLEILDGAYPRPKKIQETPLELSLNKGIQSFINGKLKYNALLSMLSSTFSHSALSLVIGQKTSRPWETHEEGTPPFLDPMFLDSKEN